MYPAYTYPTSAARRLTAPPRLITVPTTPGEAHNLAAALDRRADLLLAEGRRKLAEHLAHLALEARSRAREGSL